MTGEKPNTTDTKSQKYQYSVIAEAVAFVGIDVSSSAVKAVALNFNGQPVFRDSETLTMPQDPDVGSAEQDPSAWVVGVDKLMRRMGRVCDVSRIRGIGFSTTAPTLLFIDRSTLRAHGGARMWADTRGGEFQPKIGQTGGSDVGLAKIAHMKRSDPRGYQISYVTDAAGFIGRFLTGCGPFIPRAVLAAKFGVTDSEELNNDRLGELGLADLMDHFPRRGVGTGEDIGAVKPELARAWGWPTDVRCAVCGYDSIAAFAAANPAGSEKVLSVCAGTSMFAYSKLNSEPSAGCLERWQTLSGVLRNPRARLVRWGIQSGFVPLKLMCESLCGGPLDASDYARLQPKIADLDGTLGPEWFTLAFDSLPVLPYGRSIPTVRCEGRARKTAGEQTTAQIVAMMRGLAYYAVHCIEMMRMDGLAPLQLIRISGGGSQNSTMCQVIADLTQLEVQAIGKMGTALGCAMSAAANASPEISMSSIGKVVLGTEVRRHRPRPNVSRAHSSGYGHWRQLLTGVVALGRNAA